VPWPGRRVGAAAVILDRNGRILLVRHTYGQLNWELPGGASEPGESIVETVVREIREEVGVAASAQSLTGIYFDAEKDAHHFVFRCALEDEAEPEPSSPEISECAYWPADSLPRPLSDFTARRIGDALGGTALPLPVAIPPRAWLD
jgi:8-oxo-dGTP diphosphatase